jgi:hypothetical protein
MAATTGLQYTYSDTLTQKRAVTDRITMISPKDTPFVTYLGLAGSPGAFGIE